MSISIWQILIILLIVLLLFGARRLPALGRSLGEALSNFKKGLDNKSDSSKSSDEKEE